MFTKYLSLEYSEFILAFQLQFGTYEAESEHFRWEKETRHETHLAVVRFLKPEFKEILNNLYVLKAATYVE